MCTRVYHFWSGWCNYHQTGPAGRSAVVVGGDTDNVMNDTVHVVHIHTRLTLVLVLVLVR